jgi:polyadenylate-binding protein
MRFQQPAMYPNGLGIYQQGPVFNAQQANMYRTPYGYSSLNAPRLPYVPRPYPANMQNRQMLQQNFRAPYLQNRSGVPRYQNRLDDQGQQGQRRPFLPRGSNNRGFSRESYGAPRVLPFDLSAITSLPVDQQRKLLGERIYPLVYQQVPELASKITGMILELDINEVFNVLSSQDSLFEKVQEARDVLQQHEQSLVQ